MERSIMNLGKDLKLIPSFYKCKKIYPKTSLFKYTQGSSSTNSLSPIHHGLIKIFMETRDCSIVIGLCKVVVFVFAE
jgi:hypothetical protein